MHASISFRAGARNFMMCAACFFFSHFSLHAAGLNVDRQWKITVNPAIGGYPPTVTWQFESNGDVLGVKSDGSTEEIGTSYTLTGNAIKIIETGGLEVLTLTGTASANSMSGHYIDTYNGNQDASGSWTAVPTKVVPVDLNVKIKESDQFVTVTSGGTVATVSTYNLIVAGLMDLSSLSAIDPASTFTITLPGVQRSDSTSPDLVFKLSDDATLASDLSKGFIKVLYFPFAPNGLLDQIKLNKLFTSTQPSQGLILSIKYKDNKPESLGFSVQYLGRFAEEGNSEIVAQGTQGYGHGKLGISKPASLLTDTISVEFGTTQQTVVQSVVLVGADSGKNKDHNDIAVSGTYSATLVGSTKSKTNPAEHKK